MSTSFRVVDFTGKAIFRQDRRHSLRVCIGCVDRVNRIAQGMVELLKRIQHVGWARVGNSGSKRHEAPV